MNKMDKTTEKNPHDRTSFFNIQTIFPFLFLYKFIYFNYFVLFKRINFIVPKSHHLDFKSNNTLNKLHNFKIYYYSLNKK